MLAAGPKAFGCAYIFIHKNKEWGCPLLSR